MDDYISRKETMEAISALTVYLGGESIFHPEAKKSVLNAIDDIPGKPLHEEWISVKDRLPKTDGEVLAVLFGRVYMCWYLSATKQFEAPSGIVWDIDDVTHWMLLPEVPKEETK